MKKHSKKYLISCGLMLTGGVVMVLRLADSVTVAGAVLVFVGALLFSNLSSVSQGESK